MKNILIAALLAMVGGPAFASDWIQSVADDGSVIILEDGTVWLIDDFDQLDSRLWMSLDNIVVTTDRATGDYLLINTDDRTRAHAQLLEVTPRFVVPRISRALPSKTSLKPPTKVKNPSQPQYQVPQQRIYPPLPMKSLMPPLPGLRHRLSPGGVGAPNSIPLPASITLAQAKQAQALYDKAKALFDKGKYAEAKAENDLALIFNPSDSDAKLMQRVLSQKLNTTTQPSQ